MFKKLDWYIIRKVIVTFFFSLICVLSIAVVFDISEKLDDFIKCKMSVWQAIQEYYLYFIFYIGNMLYPLFALITIAFVAIQMNQRNEIVAILSSGVGFKRMLAPFFMATGILVVFFLFLNHSFIPYANKQRLAFENKCTGYSSTIRDAHFEIEPGVIISYKSYDLKEGKFVSKFWMDHFEKDTTGNWNLKSMVNCDYAYGDSLDNSWKLKNYLIRTFNSDGSEKIESGKNLDTTFNFGLKDMGQRTNVVSTMTYGELNEYRDKETQKGSTFVPYIEIEMHDRTAKPLSLFILALLGVCISISPSRSRVGATIFIGVVTAASYFVFNRFTTVAATNSGLNPLLAVWIPNIILLLFTMYLYKRTPK